MNRTELSTFYGEGKYADRTAKTFSVNSSHYEVELYSDKTMIENRVMKTGDTYHSERYAEDCAENWVLGVIAPIVETEKEFGGPEGPEPTRYGDWEKKGICYDF